MSLMFNSYILPLEALADDYFVTFLARGLCVDGGGESRLPLPDHPAAARH